MASFCRQCSIELFNNDFEDLANLCADDEITLVLCEGCGMIEVDSAGNCIGKQCTLHGNPQLELPL